MRLRRLRRSLEEDGSALLVTHLPNVLYLVGFRGTSGALVVTRRTAVLFVPGLYREQARGEVVGASVRVAPDPLRAAADWLRRSKLRRVACEKHHLSVAQFEQFRQWLGREVKLGDAGRLVEHLRAIKTLAEIRQIRGALALTARVFEEVLPSVRPGVRELELAAEIEFRLKRYGARAPAFETIVASGRRSALPHGRASAKRLKKNELVIFDLGAILDDYRSDMTRTVYLGRPPARVKRIYGAVQEALEHAFAAVRAGVPAARVDAAARRHLERQGLGAYFVHGTGHGLGLEIHEEPRVSSMVETRLAAGNVITLEPGVYIPGWGGVRIEDVVAVRPRGAQLLTPLSRELVCL